MSRPHEQRSTAPQPDGKVAARNLPHGNSILRIGVFDHLDRGAGALPAFYEDRLRLIELYDRVGLYAYHLAEHHGTPLGMAPSPSVFLAAVAQRTKRLRFGPTVYCLPLYPPLRLIEEICMLDQMSGGRLELGVGRGISPIEVAFFDLDPAETPAMYREGLDFILQGLADASAGHDFSFEGDHYRAVDVPMILAPVQQPHPPLWYGLGRPDSAAWAAANRVNVISNQPPERTRAITDAYRSAWREAGRSEAELPMMGIAFHLVIAGDGARGARNRAARLPGLARQFLSSVETGRPGADRHRLPGRIRRPDGDRRRDRRHPGAGAREDNGAGRGIRRQLPGLPHGLRRPELRGIGAHGGIADAGGSAGAKESGVTAALGRARVGYA